MGISAVIITKNEERNIGRCLASLAGLVDEMIVVDTFSKDRTQEICREHGARVVEKEWMGYSATKNFANDLAAHEYILSLDADEALDEELKGLLMREKEQLQGVYEFNRLAFYCGRPIRRAGWYPDRKIRLFPKGGARWEGAFVHEELVPQPNLPVKRLSGHLLHYTYYTIGEHIARANKYSDLAAQGIAQSGKTGLRWRARLSAALRFFKMYILKGGFLEGRLGYAICRITAMEVYLKYAKAAELRKQSASSS